MAHLFRRAMENGNAALHSETRLASITRIEEKSGSDHFRELLVGMTKDNNVRLLAAQSALERLVRRVRIDYVVDEKFAPRELDDFCLSIVKSRIIRIALDRGHGGNLFKLQDEPRLTDVACMKDVVNSLEK